MRYTPRKKLLVDSKVQGALLVRAAGYWLLFALAVVQLTLIFQIANSPDGPFLGQFDLAKLWHDHSVVAISALMMLPIVLLDTAFISNRIVGPLVRIRKAMRQLAAGESVRPIKLRKNDFFQSMADEVNAVAARMNRLNEPGQIGIESDSDSFAEPAIAIEV